MTTNLKAEYAGVLLNPRVTEKASYVSESGVYTFEVAKSANKASVAKAIKVYFDVTPRKITIVNTPKKKVLVRGKVGYKAGLKKAYVFLKKGDSINLT